MQRKSQRIEGERTRREFLTGAAALGAVAAIPARLSGLGIERTAPVEAAGAGSLRAHAAARGLMYGTAVNPALLDLEGATAGNSTDPYTRLLAVHAYFIVV
jgi:hypothetical protein